MRFFYGEGGGHGAARGLPKHDTTHPKTNPNNIKLHPNQFTFKFKSIQIAVPSRTDVPEYQRLRSMVHEVRDFLMTGFLYDWFFYLTRF